jgi:hypothetical protein
MRATRFVLIPVMSLACGIAFQTAASAQENRGTVQQQVACTPDVFRLCSEQIPDTNRIVACLRENTPQLSGACRAVFDSNAELPQQPAPARRLEPPRRFDDR